MTELYADWRSKYGDCPCLGLYSVANKYTFVWKKTTERNKEKLEGKIKDILSRIDEGIAQDNAPVEETSEMDSSTLQRIIEGINETTAKKEKEGAAKQDLKKRKKTLKQLQKAQEKLAEYEDKLETLGDRNSYAKTDLDATFDKYRAQNCEGCPLRCRCFQARGNRIIQVNRKLNSYKRKARERLLSEEGLKHRSRRPIEPEAVFGQIKFNKQYRRFRHRGLDKVKMDFAILAMSFNIQKLWRTLAKKTINAPSDPNNSKKEGYKPVLSPDLTKIKDFSLDEYFSIKIVA